MADPAKWESVQRNPDRETIRLPVPGGWLYLVTEKGDLGGILNQMLAFVPKPALKPRSGHE